MKIELDNIKQEIIAAYGTLKSSYKVAELFNTSSTAVKRVLKNAGVLRTQKLAALERDNSYCGKYERTNEHKTKLSELAKNRTAELNPFFGKTHSEENKQKFSENAKARLSELNPNFKNGKNIRRPRDLKNGDFQKLRNFVFNRDSYTCQITGKKGGHLHCHHLLPYWVCPEAFFDVENMITVTSEVHFVTCHNKSWGSFNIELIPQSLISKYSIHRERLNELASIWKNRRCDSLTSNDIPNSREKSEEVSPLT